MNDEISNSSLNDFIHYAMKSNIDFAKITYACCAYDFVDKRRYRNNGEEIEIYKFKEICYDTAYLKVFPRYVLSIGDRSYLMYELQEEITVWVCYTDEKHRRRGYMTRLLKSLIQMYPNTKITVDTFNESLRKICKSLGIALFRQ